MINQFKNNIETRKSFYSDDRNFEKVNGSFDIGLEVEQISFFVFDMNDENAVISVLQLDRCLVNIHGSNVRALGVQSYGESLVGRAIVGDGVVVGSVLGKLIGDHDDLFGSCLTIRSALNFEVGER